MKRSIGSQAGFSLLEIMLVVAIIALLAGAAVMKMKGNVGVAKTIRAQGDVQSIVGQLMLYEATNGHYPSTEQGLKALVDKPTSEPRPRSWQKLLPEVPVDPWGMEYRYERPAKRSKDPFDLYSAGPNNQPGDSDDVGNWRNDS
ncbi:type II secretion system major pseudopilin GspG [Verrucomicrobiota bacterium sgz303538]